MTFEIIQYVGIIGFFLLALILVVAFILGDIFPGRRFRYSFLIAHTVLISVAAVMVSRSQDALSDILWVIPLQLDVVLQLLNIIFHGFVSGSFTYILFLLIGGAQWYFAGLLIDYLCPKIPSVIKS